MGCKKFIALLILGAAVLSELGALELTRGKIRLRIQESSGRLSVFFAPDLSAPRFLPLYFADDPSTSGSFLQVDGEVLPLIPGRDFRLQVAETATGAQLVWTGTRISVTQNLDFVSSPGSGVADGVRVTYLLTNPVPRNLRGALKVLLDTSLGETGTHFTLKDGRQVNSELTLTGSEIQTWSSFSSGSPSTGLQFSLDSSATVPSKIIFANWKRLNEGGWEMVSVPGRSFNNLPYSVNDSAAAVYYGNLALAPGETVQVVMNFGNSGAPTMEGARLGTENAYSDILDLTRERSAEDIRSQLEKDRAVVDDLLVRIESGLGSGQTFSPQDLEIMRAILEELNRRKALYREK